jgi:hypothetical protein
MPPTPVAAPWYGSTADGWLCDSILKATAQPSPTEMTPAFSPGPCSTQGAFVGSVLSIGRECLYEQCSLHSALTTPSSVKVGVRPSMLTSRSYSNSVMPCSATSAGVMAGSPGRGWTCDAVVAECDDAHARHASEHRLEDGLNSGRPSVEPSSRFERPLGVRHHAEHVARRVDDAGDVAQRAVGVGGGRSPPAASRSGTPRARRPRAGQRVASSAV